MAWSLQAAVRKLPGVSRSEQKMDTDSMVPQQQLPQIAARLHVMEPRLEAKQAVLTELSAADYKSRTGGGRGGVFKGKRVEEVLCMTHPLRLPHEDDGLIVSTCDSVLKSVGNTS